VVSPSRLSVCRTTRFRSTPPCVIPTPNQLWAPNSATHNPALHIGQQETGGPAAGHAEAASRPGCCAA
ncbi:hypothetical protein LDENG_00184470, partial [Lucifuga dentata]